MTRRVLKNPILRRVPLVALLAVFCAPAYATVTASPGDVNFGKSIVGSATGPIQVVLSNSNKASVKIEDVSTSLSQFSYLGPSVPVSLAPGASLTVLVTFKPSAAHSFRGQLVFARANGSPIRVLLTGTGVSNQPPISNAGVPSGSSGSNSSGATSPASGSSGAGSSVTTSSANSLPVGTSTNTSGSSFPEEAAAIAAHLNVARMSQIGQRADGNPQMTFRADAIAHDGHALFAVRQQPVIVRQHDAGDGLADRFHGFFPLPLARTGLKLECLKREQTFHDILHSAPIITQPPGRWTAKNNRLNPRRSCRKSRNRP